MLLFTSRSLLTMVHGIVLGGGALMGLSAALFTLYATRTSVGPHAAPGSESRALAGLAVITALLLWLTVIGGTYIVFPPYRAAPPAGLIDLAGYPRSAILANPGTAWLHGFAMETKEHVPWIASMLATAVAFMSVRYRFSLLSDAQLRKMTGILLAVSFALVSFVALMGIFVNKVAPLQ